MKIVDRKTFLRMPAGVVFAKYKPMMFEGPCIKGDSIDDIDFYYRDLCEPWFDGDTGSDTHFEIICRMEGGASAPVDYNTESRDGLFEGDQLFAIYEREDVKRLLEAVEAVLEQAL